MMMMTGYYVMVWIAWVCYINNFAMSFTIQSPVVVPLSRHYSSLFQLRSSTGMESDTSSRSSDGNVMYEEIKYMKIREIKKELECNNISTNDVFEKEELIQRLYQFRQKNNKKETSTTNDEISKVPLYFYSLSSTTSVSAKNHNDVHLRPSMGMFPAIQVRLSNGSQQVLTLLLDTACSGLVIRPSVIQKYNIPMYGGSASMTAAGGNTSTGGIANMGPLMLEDGSYTTAEPAAVQDIGALPNELDGIIGLSFLKQYETIEFDFQTQDLRLSKKQTTLEKQPKIDDNLMVVAEGVLKICRIGVYTVECMFDGRGPVNMLLDTGAASTLFNWDGISSLNMDVNHPLISRHTNLMGAMGADNNALSLTHYYSLKQRINFVSTDAGTTPFGPIGLEMNGSSINVDIGNIPVLDTLKVDKVGGILGSDVLMKCDILRMQMNNNGKTTNQLPMIQLLKRQNKMYYD